jgi:hypothetical protein
MSDLAKQLEELKEESKELKLQREVAAYTLQNQAARGVLLEGWGDLVDRTEFLRDTPGFFPTRVNRLSLPYNRKDGDFFPHFRTEQELQEHRGSGEYLGVRHPVGIGLLDDLANYTISTGFTYTVAHRDTSTVNDKIVLACQDVINEFISRVNGEFSDQVPLLDTIDEGYSECSFEREIFKRSRAAGEAIVNIEHLGDGYSGLETAEPSWLTEPKNSGVVSGRFSLPDGMSWKYGIASVKGRPTRIKGYFITWNGEKENWRFHHPEEVIHVKCNVPRGVKRGLPDFYGVEQHLEDHSKLLRNTARGAAIQASIALIREHQPGMSSSEVERLITGQKDYTVTSPALGSTGTVRQRKIREYTEGTVLDVVGSKYHPGPLGSPNGPTYVEIGQAIMRIVGSRWSMPEHMISNAISGAGGARSAVVELGTPFARATKNRQRTYAKHFQNLMWRVIKIAAFYGRIPASFSDIRSSLEVRVGVPEATQRNEAEQHLVLAGRHQAGVISMETWRETVGIDNSTEQERIMDEQATLLNPQNPQSPNHPLNPQNPGNPLLQPPVDELGANKTPEGVTNQAAGGPGKGEVGRQLSSGAGADSTLGFNQDRSLGTRNAKQSIKQQLAAARAGKNVNIR